MLGAALLPGHPCLRPLLTHRTVYLSTLLPVLLPQNDSPAGAGSCLFPAQCWAHKREFSKLWLKTLMSDHIKELTRFTLEASAATAAAGGGKTRIQSPVEADMHSDCGLGLWPFSEQQYENKPDQEIQESQREESESAELCWEQKQTVVGGVNRCYEVSAVKEKKKKL